MSHTLSEHESKQLLAKAGIAIPDERLVESPDAAVQAAADLGFPVALKLCGRKIAHKTERGLVRLGLHDAASVRAAAEALFAARRPEDGDARVLVCRMVSGRREVIAGLVRDPQFGPCVMLGLGGIFAEALGDVAFAVAPLARGDAEDLIDALQYKRILGEFRGEPPVDRAALARVLETLGRIGAERADVRSIDINPLIVAGATPVVIDALVELEGAA
jgi:acetate---CoA ligase (ADP-forming) subunit beta